MEISGVIMLTATPVSSLSSIADSLSHVTCTLQLPQGFGDTTAPPGMVNNTVPNKRFAA
jgi:hypothetical protein